ncbi:ABC transporter permease subunit [Rhizobium leguminosarum]|uniref:ABC transporter permease n=1 Tax=Rhizobium leguminosarum TaxID=384 RepID=UPI001C93E09B|nr:ABC transporter permease subunit [Rhizobium leguminosarum]MBY5460883.1 ABC transporter permease subunit [Rhizobium leguminosarum]
MWTVVEPYVPLVLQGTYLTILVALLSMAGALLIGLIGALGSIAGGALTKRAVDLYTTVIRGVPDLVLMLLLYYGGQMMLNRLGELTGLWDYVEISAFMAGTITIAIIFGAYTVETFRGAALNIPKGQIEAGLAIGLSRRRLFGRIIWPQLLSLALPGIGNNWQVLMKTTALVSVIGLQDVVNSSFQAGRTTRHMFVFMGVALIIYLVITMISGLVISYVAHRYGSQTRSELA